MMYDENIECLSKQEIYKILQLEDGDQYETKNGAVWMRFLGDSPQCQYGLVEDEFMVSPHGDRYPDLESSWIDRQELLDYINRKGLKL